MLYLSEEFEENWFEEAMKLTEILCYVLPSVVNGSISMVCPIFILENIFAIKEGSQDIEDKDESSSMNRY